MKKYKILCAGINKSGKAGSDFIKFWANSSNCIKKGKTKGRKLVRQLSLKSGRYWISELDRPWADIDEGLIECLLTD